MRVGKRFLSKMWRWEHCPYKMISGLSLISVSPVNRLEVPTSAHWGYLLFSMSLRHLDSILRADLHWLAVGILKT